MTAASSDLIPKWPRIRENLERWRIEIGYVTLQTYFPDRAGSQVARLNMEDRMLRYWLEYGPDHESDEEERVNSTLDRLSRGIPTGVPDDGFNLDIDKADDAEAEADDSDDGDDGDDAFDLDAAFAALEDGEPEAEDLDEDAEADDDEPEEEVEEDEPAAVPLSAEECVIAIRKWLLASCENNCPTGQQQQFRIRLYAPKGRQLWSKLFDYRSSTAPMAIREPHQQPQPAQPVPAPVAPLPGPAVAFAVPTDDEPVYAPPPTPSQATQQHSPMYAGGGYPGQPPRHPDPARIQELYSMDPANHGNNGHAGGIPAMGIPTAAQMEQTAMAAARPNGGAEGIAQLSPATLSKMAPEELALLISMMQNAGQGPQFHVDTLLQLHGLYRGYGALVFNTFREATMVYQKMLGQLTSALEDSRSHNDDLLGVVQQLRLTEIEKSVEYQENNDKLQMKTQLGREAIQQGGLIARVLLQNRNRGQEQEPSNGHGHSRDHAPAEGPDLSNPYADSDYEDYDDEEGPEEDNARFHADKEGRTTDAEAEAADGEDGSIDWMAERPDVIEAMGDPNVKAYLADPANVEQLRTLAQMMNGGGPLNSLIEATSDPAPPRGPKVRKDAALTPKKPVASSDAADQPTGEEPTPEKD